MRISFVDVFLVLSPDTHGLRSSNLFYNLPFLLYLIVSVNSEKRLYVLSVIEQSYLCQKQESQIFHFIRGKHRGGCLNAWWSFQEALLKSLCMSTVLMSFYDGFQIPSGFRLFLVFLDMIGIRRVRRRLPVVP